MSEKLWPVPILLLAVSLPSAAQTPAKEGAANTEKALLEAVGTLSAAHLYQSYLNIGFLADGKAGGTYGEKEAAEVLRSVVGLVKTVDQQLDKLAKAELPKEDRQSLEQLRKASQLLLQEADELAAYWKTGDKDRGAKYEKTRQEAWQVISKLIGIK